MRMPSLRARWLAQHIRGLRDDQGLTLKYVAAHLGMDFSKLARFERGDQPFTRDQVIALLDLYRAHDPDERATLLRLAQATWRPQWAADFDGAVPDESFGDLLWLESEATQIRCYSPLSIPELLHSAGYAEKRARETGIAASVEHVAARVRLTTERQQILSRAPTPAELTVVLDECVLKHPDGDQRMWDGQIENLRRAAALPNVHVRVLPAGRPRPPGVEGGFAVFTLPQPSPLVVHIPYLGGRLFLEHSHDHVNVFDRLYRSAADADESASLLELIPPSPTQIER
ncbi:helix-turn-helix domain-containing protein [Micromonospora sp. CPCC 206061]|uniref:helix-turn-helix domain-containing protein n=1 Tax=Micromonospora sp. CPCC 206061 TaxID=3122410 RepID=UPI002FEEEF85